MVATNRIVVKQQDLTELRLTLVGAKAYGLWHIPSSWVPRFFVIGSDLFIRFRQRRQNGTSKASCRELICPEEFDQLNGALDDLNVPLSYQVIVRSSGVTEGIESRGKFCSCKSAPNAAEILDTCDRIFTASIEAQDAAKANQLELALIVQLYVEPKAMGHLSNERRVARRKQDWLYEFESGEDPLVGRFAIKSHTVHADPQKELVAANRDDLIRNLREAAAYFDGQGVRLHIEWVWDGQKLWTVQGDRDIERRGENPASFLTMANPVRSSYSLRCFKLWTSIQHERWLKVNCLRNFSKAGLACSPVWVLEDEVTLRELQEGRITPDLRDDLQKLLVYPIVVRTDTKQSVDTSSSMEDQMLPRTDSVINIQDAQKFLVDQSRSLKSSGDTCGYCFIVHHYIPARSSAFCLAKPQNPRVRVDSIWGLADGLLFYPYDSFQLDTEDTKKIIKRLRFKDDYLATDPYGIWKPFKAGIPWDWSMSITREELLLISNGTKKLSDFLRKCVSVMWFVGIPSNTGLPIVLPWWYKQLDAIPQVEPALPCVFGRRVVVVSTKQDLARLQSYGEDDLKRLVLRLSPEPDLLREKQFLNDVASLAIGNKLPVELHGSPLQHAYYELKRIGVRVRCIDFDVRPMSPSQYFTKLVRDQIPRRIQLRGEHARISRTAADYLTAALKEKVIEEAYELFWTSSGQEVKEELADILELIIAIALRQGLSLEDVEKMAERKRRERGGFQEGLILVETSELPLIETEEERRFIDAQDNGKIVTIRSIPRIMEDGSVSIPVVPPGVHEAQLRLARLNIDLTVRYDKRAIVLRFIERQRPTTQEPLPFNRTPGADSSMNQEG